MARWRDLRGCPGVDLGQGRPGVSSQPAWPRSERRGRAARPDGAGRWPLAGFVPVKAGAAMAFGEACTRRAAGLRGHDRRWARGAGAGAVVGLQRLSSPAQRLRGALAWVAPLRGCVTWARVAGQAWLGVTMEAASTSCAVDPVVPVLCGPPFVGVIFFHCAGSGSRWRSLRRASCLGTSPAWSLCVASPFVGVRSFGPDLVPRA